MVAKQNKEKASPKGAIRFSITLSDEQKVAKAEMLKHAFNFILGNAGSGKTGDILFTTKGHSSGDTYSITLEMVKVYSD